MKGPDEMGGFEATVWMILILIGSLFLVIIWALGLLYMLSWFFTLWWGF
jgi:hypothetical protein